MAYMYICQVTVMWCSVCVCVSQLDCWSLEYSHCLLAVYTSQLYVLLPPSFVMYVEQGPDITRKGKKQASDVGAADLDTNFFVGTEVCTYACVYALYVVSTQ